MFITVYQYKGVAVDQLGQIYIVDCDNHRVVRWRKEATEGDVVVGGKQQESESTQISCPKVLPFDLQGNLDVVNQLNHRIQKFETDFY